MQLSKLPILLLFLIFGSTLSAQNRYLEPKFSEVSVSPLTPYGFNYTFLPILFGGHFTKQPLAMQVYTPVGDTETARPLIIYLHTGNFFPFPANGSCGGAINDSSNVEFATRLAQMGYVVAVVDYRLGWNPFSTAELTRRFTLINGAYRGVQDVRSCIRYFRKNVAVDGNDYGIDPNKIVVWGQGTGGYLSLATAYLDKFTEIYTTADPNKFKIPLPNGAFYPMVQESYNGDINGEQTAIGVVDATYNSIFSAFPLGDTMYIPNTPGYSSSFNLAVNMGGALGDSSWMEAGDIPLISYHVPSDFFAPCETDILNVPTAMGPQPVVEVSGSCDMQEIANSYGLNGVFNTIPAGHDPYGANSSSSFNGFYPFYGTPTPPGATMESSGPWAWTSYAGTPAPTASGCEVDGAVARAYIDTIIGYYAPRACVALNLGCNFVSTKELNELELGLQVSPVPAVDAVTFQTKETPIRHIYVYDLSGRLVKAHTNINNNVFQMQRNSLQNGMYIAELRFDNGFVKRKVVFNN
ncbi:MAG: T9SS type A sorting domain-containing protein [Saprospiraceae bacterium]|nr:T9SS type A sorting domain-containing protein [Saprospiraceae bacterium]